MKISIASVALAMLAGVAVARNCDDEYDYCGFTLNKIGALLKRFWVEMHLLTLSRQIPERDGEGMRGRRKAMHRRQGEERSFRLRSGHHEQYQTEYQLLGQMCGWRGGKE
jgi:hypothetical protein